MWHWTKYFWMVVIFSITFIGIGWTAEVDEDYTVGMMGLEYHNDVQVLATMGGVAQKLVTLPDGEFWILNRFVIGRIGSYDVDIAYLFGIGDHLKIGPVLGPSVNWEDIPEDGAGVETYWTATCGLVGHYYLGDKYGGLGFGGGAKYKYYDGHRYDDGWAAGFHITKRL